MRIRMAFSPGPADLLIGAWCGVSVRNGWMSSAMNIIKIENKTGYLKVEIGGGFSLPEAKEIAFKIMAESNSHGIKKWLIDARDLTGEFSIMDRYAYGKYLGNFDVKVAIIASVSMILPDKFFENVVTNSGGSIIVTTDPNEAAQWLGIS